MTTKFRRPLTESLGWLLLRVLLGYLGVVPSQIEMSILVDVFSVSAHVAHLGALTGFCAHLAAHTFMFSCASFNIKIQI